MTIRVEALRGMNNWEKVDFGPTPFVVKSNISNFEAKYIVTEDEQGQESFLYKFIPTGKDDLSKAVKSVSGVLYDISVDEITKDKPAIIEGLVPGGTKSELLRITQE